MTTTIEKPNDVTEATDGGVLSPPPCLRFHVSRDFGHPWTREIGWDLLELRGETEERLSEMIAQAERKFWKTWIRDNTGQCKAAMYKPSGALSEWIDPIIRTIQIINKSTKRTHR